MGDRILATVRTVVPAMVGYALAWLAAEHGIVLSDRSSELVYLVAGAVATGAYHSAASWLQRRWVRVIARWPRAGRVLGVVVALLLGSARQPTYRAPG